MISRPVHGPLSSVDMTMATAAHRLETGAPCSAESCESNMANKRRILFLCTGNSCRSQMAEAILRHLAGDRFTATSAGSDPAGFVHPLAIEVLQHMGIPLHDPRSKSWDEFAQTPVDAVITLCDDAAGEVCPTWPGDPVCAHWSLPDPAGHLGAEKERLELALRIAGRLRTKIEALLKLDWSTNRADLAERLKFLGEI